MGKILMKKTILAAALSFAIAPPVGAQTLANMIAIDQRNATDTGYIRRLLPMPGETAFIIYNNATVMPDYLKIGSNLSITDGVLNVTIPAQQNADWNASSGVARILNKPTFSTVAFSGLAADVVGLSTVATSGSYADLSGKPSIPAAQVNADWSAASGVASILNKPSLSTVATSGAYADLSGKPALATVATSGSYADLSNKPTIPGAFAVSAPNSRTLSLATAYQCTDTSKACIVTVNLNSTASLTLSGGTTITGEVRVGSSNTVATGGGTALGAYKNSMTGTLTVGLNIQTDSYNTITVAVPAGYYFAVRQTAGSGLVIVSAFDQSAG